MKNLFLQSLYDVLPIDSNHEIDYIETNVYREYENIDILIETDDCYIIIENKVFSGLHNDLKKYRSSIIRKRKNDNNEHKQIIPIVLSLRCDLDEYERIKIDKNEYIHITHKIFLNKVKSNLGDYIESADGEWLIFLKNFIGNMISLEGDNLMQKDINETLKFFDENYDVYLRLIEKRKEIVDYLNSEMKTAQKIIESELESKYSCKFIPWNSLDYLASTRYAVFPNEIHYNEFHIDRVLKGWEILLRLRRKRDFDDTINWLGEKGIHKDQNESIVNDNTIWTRITLWTCKTEDNPDITPREVAIEAIEILKKLKAL
jgi:hypothetical protein